MATKSGNKKSGSASASKPSNKPDAAGKAVSAIPERPKRAYKRTPIMTRASKLVAQLGKKAATLLRMASRWTSDDETPEQTDALNAIVDSAKEIAPRIADAAASMQVLIDTKWAPKAGSPGRRALEIGDAVVIKDKFYDSEMHGAPNRFTVLATTEKFVRLGPASNGTTTTTSGLTGGFPIERSRVKGAPRVGGESSLDEGVGEDID